MIYTLEKSIQSLSLRVGVRNSSQLLHKLSFFFLESKKLFIFSYWSTPKTLFFDKYVIFHVDCWNFDQKIFQIHIFLDVGS